MKIIVQVRLDDTGGDPAVVAIAAIERAALSAASLGLSIAAGKVVGRIQEVMTVHQVDCHGRTH